jgi:hypothetical protein
LGSPISRKDSELGECKRRHEAEAVEQDHDVDGGKALLPWSNKQQQRSDEMQSGKIYAIAVQALSHALFAAEPAPINFTFTFIYS